MDGRRPSRGPTGPVRFVTAEDARAEEDNRFKRAVLLEAIDLMAWQQNHLDDSTLSEQVWRIAQKVLAEEYVDALDIIRETGKPMMFTEEVA